MRKKLKRLFLLINTYASLLSIPQSMMVLKNIIAIIVNEIKNKETAEFLDLTHRN